MILGTARSLKRKSEPTIALKNGRPSPETVFGNAKFAIFIWCPADPTSLPQACREGGQSVAVGRGAGGRAGIQFWRGRRNAHPAVTARNKPYVTLLWLPYKIFQRRRCGGRMSFAFRWRRRGREAAEQIWATLGHPCHRSLARRSPRTPPAKQPLNRAIVFAPLIICQSEMNELLPSSLWTFPSI